MIDYISITKHTYKDNPYFGNCKPYKSFGDGLQVYYLEGCERMEVWHNSKAHLLKVKGSLPYYLNGHNFNFSSGEFVEAIDNIDALLGNVGLWGAFVDEFENGVIMQVDDKPKEYIQKHSALPKTKLKLIFNEGDGGRFARWHRVWEDVKMYDAGANIKMKQGMQRQAIIEGAGWNPEGNYLKFEMRYHRPLMLNHNKPVIVEALQNETFTQILKEDLMKKYHLLAPAKGLVLPTDKKNFTSLDAVLFTLAESMINGQGRSLQEVKKLIYGTINQAGCLTGADKDARKLQVRKALQKLEEESESRWDLTNDIRVALDVER